MRKKTTKNFYPHKSLQKLAEISDFYSYPQKQVWKIMWKPFCGKSDVDSVVNFEQTIIRC